MAGSHPRSKSTTVSAVSASSPRGRSLPPRPLSFQSHSNRARLPAAAQLSQPQHSLHSIYCQIRTQARERPDAVALVGRGIESLRALRLSQQPRPQAAEEDAPQPQPQPPPACQSWTYSELERQVGSWATVLCARWEDLLGHDASFRVGLYLPRSADSLLLMLVCLRLGVTMVPLDVHYPPVKTIAMIAAARLHSIVSIRPTASYPSIAQLVTLAQQAASDPISNLVQGVQLLDVEDIAREAAAAALSPSASAQSGPPAAPSLHAADTTNGASSCGPHRCDCLDASGRPAPCMFSSAYLLFTSGSTGASKAVPMSQYQLSLHIAALTERLPLTAADVFIPMASFCFVAHTRLWSALASGSALCLPSDQERTAVLPFSSLLSSLSAACGLQVTVLDTSPAFLRMLLQDAHGLLTGQQQQPQHQLSSLRRVTLAGEIVTWKMTQSVYAAHARCCHADSQLQIVNLYGATECASTICAFTVPRQAAGAGRRDSNGGGAAAVSSFVPVGQPLASTSIHLLDDQGQLLPVSSEAVGHVHVGGGRIEVSAGYDRDANNTMRRYSRHPQLGNARLFQTGDMGRWVRLPGQAGAGQEVLELVGRSDNLVKVRGQRVELEELETTLAGSDQVAQAQVVAHRSDFQDEEETLLAFVVPSDSLMQETATDALSTPLQLPTPVASRRTTLQPSAELSVAVSSSLAEAQLAAAASSFSPRGSIFKPLNSGSSALLRLASSLRAEVGRHHPFYYVPKHFVFVSALGRTPNGKLDRQAAKVAAADWFAQRKQEDDARRIEEAGEDEGGHEAEATDVLHLAMQRLDTAAAEASGAAAQPAAGHRRSLSVVDRYAVLLKQLSGMERALWAVWLRVFTFLSARRQLEALQAVVATKRGEGGDVSGADDFDFFALGGDSLMANQLVSLSAAAPDIRRELTVRQVFQSPNLIAMAELLQTAPPAAAAPDSAASATRATPAASRRGSVSAFPRPASVSGVDGNGWPYAEYPLSPSESALWFAAAVAGRALAAHHITHVYSLVRTEGNGDDVNLRALETSLQYLVQRHEALRTVFVQNAQAEPRQRVLTAGAAVADSSLPVSPTSSSTRSLRPLSVNVAVQTVTSAAGMARVVDSIDHAAFELHAWPLFRLTLIRVKKPQDGQQAPPEPQMAEEAATPEAEYRVQLPHQRRLSRSRSSSQPQPLTSDTYLCLTIHHLVSDGWSSGMFMRELAACYAHFSDPNSARRFSSTAAVHPALPARALMQYAEFQQAQAERLRAEEAAHLAYWCRELKDAAYLELPYDFSRPPQRSYEGDVIHLDFPSSLSAALHALSLSTRCSLFNLLMASLQLLMGKYSGQQDLVLGTASANRDSTEQQQVMGFCINMVACRGQLDQSLSFIAHARQVQHKTLEALEHGRVPFSQVVQAVDRERGGGGRSGRDPSRNPLFDVILLLQNQPIRKAAYALTQDGSLQLARVPFRAAHSQFDLAFILEPTGDRQLQLAVNFNVQVFRRESVRRMVDNWLHLIQRLLAAPSLPMSQHDWISEQQRQQVVHDFNAKTQPVPVSHPAQHYFEQQVARCPDAPAVESWEQRWTYAELEQKANQVANAVLSAYAQRYGQQLRPDTLLGLYVDRKAGCVMPAAVLGILKAGAAYVPLDPTYPEARLGYMIADSSVRLLLTVDRMRDSLSKLIAAHNAAVTDEAERVPAIPVLSLDEIVSASSLQSALRPPVINSVSDLAYVIYTSGSTGKPKGVMIQHLSVVNLLHFMRPHMTSHPQLDGSSLPVPRPRCLQFSSISFDVAVFEWATTFSCGGCLCLVPSVDQLLGEALLHTVQRYAITTLLASASSVAAVPLNSGPGGGCLVDLSGLSFMSCGSEALQEAVLHRWMSACPASFFNQYGPTEVTVTSHMVRYLPVTGFPFHSNRVIGGGISNVQSYVCDERMKPVPIGVQGELFIGGAGVARGYLNRPELTQARFIPNPFLSRPLQDAQLVAGVSTDSWESTRLYRTGDVVRWTVAGELEYLGRNDDQVKVRGFRVEIGEIEKRVLEHRDVHTTVVVLRQERQNGQEHSTPTLTCFFTLRQPVAPDSLPGLLQQLRAHVGQTLPAYMVPVYFVLQDAIPQTCTGKFDRNALTAMDIQPYLRQLKRAAKRSMSGANGKLAAAPKPLLLSPPLSPSAAPRRRLGATDDGLLPQLRQAWATALSVEAETLEPSDHFFEVGGHSLLTLRLLALLPSRLQQCLTLADIFANPTLQSQLELLRRRLQDAGGSDLFSTTPRASGAGVKDGAQQQIPPILRSGSSVFSSAVGDVAIVGMAGRFPGASSVAALWSNLLQGRESIRHFSREELLAAGVEADSLSAPGYVRACGLMLEGEAGLAEHGRAMFGFDSGFFDFSPRDAEMLDPQQRHFLEVCHQALEDAGCVPSLYQQAVDEQAGEAEPTVGVFAGCGRNTYLSDYLSSSYDTSGSAAQWHSLSSANDKDFLCSRVSYKLGLLGPACVVQTACSSSLVAVHAAVAAIQRGECEVALAGGVSLGALHAQGYTYQPDHILAPDGHCRALDAQAAGTMRGQGLAVVVLKPLRLALRDRDQVYAVVRASAINNDGSSKASYAAPNPDGQRRVIRQTFRSLQGDIGPRDIGYVEAHGTGTKIGDVIELTALTQAYREAFRISGQEREHDGDEQSLEERRQQEEEVARDVGSAALPAQYCAIGSVKTNIGHLDAAAGVAGLVKAALAVQHALVPPTLHFTAANPALQLESSPFFVAAQQPLPFPSVEGELRRAAVSSFGIGGTNAHVIIEQAPQQADDEDDAAAGGLSEQHMVCWSAKSAVSGRAMAAQLLAFYRAAAGKELSAAQQSRLLANSAFTLQKGRSHYSAYRQAVVASDLSSLVSALTAVTETAAPHVSASESARSSRTAAAKPPSVCLFFPGQGCQFLGMGVQLYGSDAVFRCIADECWQLIRSLPSLYPALLPEVVVEEEAVSRLWAAQPSASWLAPLSLFTLQFAVCQRLARLGIRPAAVCGHSLGHFLAACVSGAISLHAALIMLTRRSHLLHTLQSGQDSGAMLSVSASVQQLQALMADGLEVAGVNSPGNTVLAGSSAAIAALQAACSAAGLRSVRVHTSHAFHSAFIAHILPAYGQTLQLMRETDISSATLLSCSALPPAAGCLLADTVTGSLLQVSSAASPPVLSVEYWLQHTRQAVQYQAAVSALVDRLREDGHGSDAAAAAAVCVEMGPGRTCLTLLQQTLDAQPAQLSFPYTGLQSLAGFTDVKGSKGSAQAGEDKERQQDSWHLRRAVCSLWTRRCELSFDDLWELDGRHRSVHKISLPVYAFDHSAVYCPQRVRGGRQQLVTIAAPGSPSAVFSQKSVRSPLSPSAASSSDALSLASVTAGLVRCFSSALGLPAAQLGADSDFFAEGGDSVMAVELAADINRALSLPTQAPDRCVRTSTLLLYKTVGELAAWLWQGLASKQAQQPQPAEAATAQERRVGRADVSKLKVNTSLLETQTDLLSPVSPFSSSSAVLSPRLSVTSPSSSPLAELPRQFGPLYVLQWGALPSSTAAASAYLPLVLVHAVGGDILSYHSLASQLSAQQTVFAFRAESLDGASKAVDDLPRLAAAYLRVLTEADSPFMQYWRVRGQELEADWSRTAPLDGRQSLSASITSSSLPAVAEGQMPFALGGHSFGGLVAYEMACQIQAQRRRLSPSLAASASLPPVCSLSVQRLVLLDAPAPDCLPPPLTAASVVSYIRSNRVAVAAGRGGAGSEEISKDVIDTWLAHQQAMRSYKLPAAADRCDDLEGVLFLRPSEAAEGAGGGFYSSWLEVVTDGLTVSKVRGSHVSMMQQPNVQHVANKVRAFTRADTLK